MDAAHTDRHEMSAGHDISSGQEQNVGNTERMLSMAGGGLAMLSGLRRGGAAGLLLSGLGAALLYRGASGYCPINARIGRNTTELGRSRRHNEPVHLHAGMTIDKPAAELYQYWLNVENMPRVMSFLERVESRGGDRSHWVARLPGGRTVEWDSEITAKEDNRRIAWRSIEPSDLSSKGEIRFRPAPDGRGTEVELDMSYQPPGGAIGSALGHFMRGMSRMKVQEDLRRFKRIMETGEVPTNNITRSAQ